MTDDRIYRAVPLRADEVAFLAREAGNRGAKPCCPHLDVFHTRGRTSFGGHWCACNIWGCGCLQEDPPTRVQVENSRERDALARRAEITKCADWFFIGVITMTTAAIAVLLGTL